MGRTVHNLRSLNKYDDIARREIQELLEQFPETLLRDDPDQTPQMRREREKQVKAALKPILARWKERKRVNKKSFYKPSARVKRMLWVLLMILTLFVLFFLFESFRQVP